MTASRVPIRDGQISRSPLSSRSVPVHLARGLIGLGAAALGIALVSVVGPLALLLLGVTVVAWRGCPTCWTVGLMGTLTDTRERRRCLSCETPD